MRNRAAWAALALLAGCAPAQDRCASPPVKLCAEPLPLPVAYRLVPGTVQGRNLPPHLPGDTLRRLVQPGGEAQPLYLIARGQGLRGALVGIGETPLGRAYWVTIAEDVDLARFEPIGPLGGSMYRIALRDRATGIGITYESDGKGRMIAHAPDSKLVHDLWWSSRNSSCGGGPLTRLPLDVERRWQAEYDAFLARLRAECEAKRPLWDRITAMFSPSASR